MLESIRTQRQKLGYTQVELSALSGVSLPTIQNIESGRGNPSYEVMLSLAEALGLVLQSTIRNADWNYLTGAGLPLSGPVPKNFIFDPPKFARELKQACLEEKDLRKEEALYGLLLAIKKHYPSWFRKFLSNTPVVETILKKPFSGRDIKLCRQALGRVSRFL